MPSLRQEMLRVREQIVTREPRTLDELSPEKQIEVMKGAMLILARTIFKQQVWAEHRRAPAFKHLRNGTLQTKWDVQTEYATLIHYVAKENGGWLLEVATTGNYMVKENGRWLSRQAVAADCASLNVEPLQFMCDLEDMAERHGHAAVKQFVADLFNHNHS